MKLEIKFLFTVGLTPAHVDAKGSLNELAPPTNVYSDTQVLVMCMQWFIDAVEDPPDTKIIYNQPWKYRETIRSSQRIGLMETEVRMIQEGCCIFAVTDTLPTAFQVAVANPFTHAQYMTMCTPCFEECDR